MSLHVRPYLACDSCSDRFEGDVTRGVQASAADLRHRAAEAGWGHFTAGNRRRDVCPLCLMTGGSRPVYF